MKSRTTRSLIAAILTFGASLFGQVRLSDTPAAHQISAWLAAFNSGDRATYLAFLQKNYPERAKEIDAAMGFRTQTGGFDLKQAGECSATKCSAIVQEHDSNQFARMTVEVDAADPHVIKSFELRAIPRPAEFLIPRMTEAEALKAFRANLDQAAAADRFSGAALVAKNGKPIFTAVYGMADREKKIPNKLDTKFRIGSMNKMFTATAVLQLEQAGKINLNDPLGKYLPDYPNKDVAAKSPFISCSRTQEARAIFSVQNSISTASSFARCKITSSSTAIALSASNPAAAGNTATTDFYCLVWWLKKPAARTTTITFASTSSSLLG